jgi:hypothetical protein
MSNLDWPTRKQSRSKLIRTRCQGLRRTAILGVVWVFVAGCGSGATTAPSGATTPPSAAATGAVSPSLASVEKSPTPSPSGLPSEPASAIVGEWLAQHDCAKVKAMLEGAGLQEFVGDAIFGNGLVPGVASEADADDPTQPCLGAVVRDHSHFFTADGRFGSLDYERNQVDDGRYELIEDDTVVINGTEFGYRVDGDQLALTPRAVDISGCTTKECRFEAAWVLMVAMPGTPWTRVD